MKIRKMSVVFLLVTTATTLFGDSIGTLISSADKVQFWYWEPADRSKNNYWLVEFDPTILGKELEAAKELPEGKGTHFISAFDGSFSNGSDVYEIRIGEAKRRPWAVQVYFRNTEFREWQKFSIEEPDSVDFYKWFTDSLENGAEGRTPDKHN